MKIFPFLGYGTEKNAKPESFAPPTPIIPAPAPRHYPSQVSAFPGTGDENKPTGKQDADLLTAGQGLNHSNSRQIWQVRFKSRAAQLVKNPPAMQETLA